MRNVVVIGSGLAGSLICNELAGDSSVTLLEAGLKNHMQYPKINFTQKDFGVVKTVCIGGGGTTNLWHNGLMPLNAEDVQREDFREVLNEARPFIDRAASKLYFREKSYSAEYETVRSEINSMAERTAVFLHGVDCLLYPKKYGRLYIESKVEAFYGISGFKFAGSKDRIESVKYSIGSKDYSIKPDIVIISAGTLGTPRIVKRLLFDTGRSFEPLGKGLVDHPMGFVGKVKVKKSMSELVGILSNLDRGDYICRTAARLKSECGKYAGGIFFRPALTMENKLSIYKYKSLLGASKGKDRVKNAFSPKIFHPDILAEIYSHLFGASIRSRIYSILVIFEQKRGKNSVSYNGGGIRVDWRITEEEMAVYNGMLKKLSAMLERIADDLVIRMPLTDDWIWSAAHHSGTIPLGSLPGGLIDKDLKMNLFDNVFICDGSVIQEHSYANTGLTIGALAMRLADRVRAM